MNEGARRCRRNMPRTSAVGHKETMKAVVYHRYGSPDVLGLEEVERPAPTDDRVLVRVRAASINPLDKHAMRGPFIMRLSGGGLLRPKQQILGVDMAGSVEAVGANVTKFQPGDEVFDSAPGAFAEYASAREDRLSLKPASVTLEQAAAIPVAAITALQALRDWGSIKLGQKVLINGAGGGVGSFAVQMAKLYGAEVTGVCSTNNVDLVRSLGADRVIDYTREDFVQIGESYDLILDNAGNRTLSDCRRVLASNGTLIMNAGPRRRFAGFLVRLLSGMMVSRFSSKKAVFHIAKINQKDLEVLKGLVESGRVSPTVGRSYELSKVPDAMRYLEEGHARGKIAIVV